MRLFAALLLLAPLAARAAAPTEAVKSANDRVRTALTAYTKAQGDERKAARKQVREAVETLIDFEQLVKAAAGKHWKSMTPEHHRRFTEALRGVMEANYLSKMREQGQVDVSKVDTEYLGEEKQGAHTLVKTKIKSGGDEVAVGYLMANEKGHWRAVDVLTEEVSLASSYRGQISSLWTKGGFDKVVTRLESKRKSLEAREDAVKEDSPAPPK